MTVYAYRITMNEAENIKILCFYSIDLFAHLFWKELAESRNQKWEKKKKVT